MGYYTIKFLSPQKNIKDRLIVWLLAGGTKYEQAGEIICPLDGDNAGVVIDLTRYGIRYKKNSKSLSFDGLGFISVDKMIEVKYFLDSFAR